jgi:hypothetical protein
MRTFRPALPAAALLAAALAFAGAARAQGTPQPQRVEVRGKVVDAESGTPIGGARVVVADVDGKWSWVDQAGEFLIRGVPAGERRVVVTALGYREDTLTVSAARGAGPVTLRVPRDPVELQALGVVADRLEGRRLHSTLSSRAFPAEVIATYHQPMALDFVRLATGIIPRPCSPVELVPACAIIRGEPTRVNLVLDEHASPGGIEDLVGILTASLYRVEVYRGGSLIVVYTKDYMKALLRMNAPMHPVSSMPAG